MRVWIYVTTPTNLQRLNLAPESSARSIRSSTGRKCSVTRVQSRFGDVFCCSWTTTWNNLPASLREKEVSCTEFRRQLKTFIFQTDCGASWPFWLLRLINTFTYLLTYLLTYYPAATPSPTSLPLPTFSLSLAVTSHLVLEVFARQLLLSRIVSPLTSVLAKLSQHSADTWNLLFSIQPLLLPSGPSQRLWFVHDHGAL